ncbi:hypothetical protein Patl_0677 [Paraglaciecola sp. T6c]|uniref:hypothetical protein n=1 Tax=Pseudoalteromonas atlantica (strain T6c / ATCC BAA-1087) TaxID=3042615 RepID=UPI00005C5233|nr:hypothetical protein [Paraglaciecola sp. T6c]ABG39205.1 hypothetical protein Patl_0677 [Paraglaciecola sp. T6c]
MFLIYAFAVMVLAFYFGRLSYKRFSNEKYGRFVRLLGGIAVGIIVYLVLSLIGILIFGQYTPDEPLTPPAQTEIVQNPVVNSQSEVKPSSNSENTPWYTGNFIGNQNGLTWQKASYADKLATSADIIAFFWDEDKLSQSVLNRFSNMDEVKPLAIELMNELDTAFKQADTEQDNIKLFTNQKVSSTAVIILTMKGWIK